MLARITTLWELRGADGLDPVVQLLVEALASEIFALSGELDNIEDRIVEKLARAFTPSSMMAAAPAHAILHVRSVSGSTKIHTNTEFLYKDPRFLQRHTLRKMPMTPVSGATVFDADVVSLIAANRFYKITPKGEKEHVANSLECSPVFNNTVWIGIEAGAEVQNMENMSFWFDFPLMDNPIEYARLLWYGKWSHDGKEIATEKGLSENGDRDGGSIFELYDERLRLRDEIKGKYEGRFLFVAEDLPSQKLKREGVPDELSGLFDERFIREQPAIVWFKVVFPPAFDDKGLNNLAVHINCIPVANIYSKQLLSTVSRLTPIVRLDKDDNEYFLSVESVDDSAGNRFKQVRTHEDGGNTPVYVLRRGGSERFSSLDARDFLERLLDIYRSEAIAFSGIDRDAAGTAVKMMEHLADFDRKLRTYDGQTEHTSYLVLGGKIDERTGLDVSYDITNGDIANGIRTGEVLSAPETGDVASASAILMTPTRGGSRALSEASRKDTYQYMLTSRDRVYTREDIKMFCRCYFGEYFTDVGVENGYEVGNRPKEGVIRVTRIVLRGVRLTSDAERGILANDMLVGLQRRSPDGVNYRIELK
jgi:hypothetical protein